MLPIEEREEHRSHRERKHFRPKTIYSPEYEVFLRLLREARERSGLTQEQLAERLKQDQAMVSRCFTGSRRVDIVELKAFCRAMEFPFSEFVLLLQSEWENMSPGKTEWVSEDAP